MKKDKLEQFFSDKLENFEAPYSKEAWVSLESKLGNRAGTSGLSTGAKIALFSAAAVIVAVVTFVALSEKTASPSQPIAQVEQINENLTTEENTFETDHSIGETAVEIETIHETPFNESSTAVAPTTDPVERINSENTNNTLIDSNPSAADGKITPNVTPINNKPTVDSKTNYVIGNINSTLVCKGEGIIITNLGGEHDIVRLMVNNNVTELSNKMKTSFSFSEATEIIFINGKNEVIGRELIQVLDNPKPNFDFDANIYENGLPIAKFTSYGNYKNVNWDFGNNQYAKGPEVTTHYFDKGVYEVKMTVSDINGCVGSEVKRVEITDKYNLLATNSIRLNDANLETRTFMPYCLKERGVKFTLTIIDPKDNAVVFTSTDVSKAWDGTDQRTGRVLSPFKTFIWQVQLEETMPGERGIYNGTVTIVE
jgi:hypothetical protein